MGSSRFSGNITNSGAISAAHNGLNIGGVGVSAFSGTIANSGAITSAEGMGIAIANVAGSGTFAQSIANTAKILAYQDGISINEVGTSDFSGGITNSGAVISAEDVGIAIGGVAADGTFAGNIANSAAISAQKTGLNIVEVGSSRFSGNITNSGAVTSTGRAYGIGVEEVASDGTFAGNIGNSGAVSAQQSGVGVNIVSVGSSRFPGNITNSGAISAADNGLNIGGVGVSAFSGTIANSGAITSAEGMGIAIANVAGSGRSPNRSPTLPRSWLIRTASASTNSAPRIFPATSPTAAPSHPRTPRASPSGGVAADGTFAGNIANSAAIPPAERPAFTSLRWAVRAFPATSPTVAPSRPRTGLMASALKR